MWRGWIFPDKISVGGLWSGLSFFLFLGLIGFSFTSLMFIQMWKRFSGRCMNYLFTYLTSCVGLLLLQVPGIRHTHLSPWLLPKHTNAERKVLVRENSCKETEWAHPIQWLFVQELVQVNWQFIGTDRVKFRFEFIALLDIDEVIIPVKHGNWNEMMKDLVNMKLKVANPAPHV